MHHLFSRYTTLCAAVITCCILIRICILMTIVLCKWTVWITASPSSSIICVRAIRIVIACSIAIVRVRIQTTHNNVILVVIIFLVVSVWMRMRSAVMMMLHHTDLQEWIVKWRHCVMEVAIVIVAILMIVIGECCLNVQFANMFVILRSQHTV